MPNRNPANLSAVIERLRRAWNAHDTDALVACLHPDYESIQPLHPERNLQGRESAARSWAATFEAVPDLEAELLRWAVTEDEVWTEWWWSGSHVNGNSFNAGGVMVFRLAQDRITGARVYTEIVPTSGPDWDAVLESAVSNVAAASA